MSLNPCQRATGTNPSGEHTSAELAELFGVARSTVYRAIKRAAAALGPV
ncbi:HTH domain-containing protein [Micromonospora inaquosa]|nr:HTH domain-containing protein [Micromonospora inaquosa]